MLADAFPAAADVAVARGVSPQRVYLAYLLVRGRRAGCRILLIPGARTPAHAADATAASTLVLNDTEIKSLDAGWDSKKRKGGEGGAKD